MTVPHPVGSMIEDGHSRQRKRCGQRPGRNSSCDFRPRGGAEHCRPEGQKGEAISRASPKASGPQGLSLEVFSSRSSRFSFHFIFPSILHYFTISERKVEKSYPKIQHQLAFVWIYFCGHDMRDVCVYQVICK